MYRYFFLALLILLPLSSCTKKDTLADIREAVTLDLTADVNPDSLKSYVTWMQNMGTRFCLSENRRDVALLIRNKFISFGYPGARLDSFLLQLTYRDTEYSLWQYNVTARLDGSGGSDSLTVIGGHYDSILSGGGSDPFTMAPGANDNASGVAAALELARVMKKNDFKPGGPVEFVAFAAEELGLHGSKDYCRKAYETGVKVKMMLNNDMIAYEPSANSSGWKVNIMDYYNSRGLLSIAERLAARYTLLDTYNDNSLNKYSDSYSFSQYGFPALFFFIDADDPDYHTVDDVAGNCNFNYSREIVNISAALVVQRNIFDD